MSSQGQMVFADSSQGQTAQPDPYYAQFRDQSRFWIQRVAVPLIMVIGLFGNLITVIIMTRRRMRSTTNMYLAALALVDMLYLVLTFLLGLSHYPNMAERDYYTYWQLRPFLMMLTDACSNTSVWLTVTFTIERFIAVRYPMKGKVWCTELRAKRLIAFVFLFGIIFASPVPFEWEVVERRRSPVDNETPAAYTLTLENSDFGRNETYKTIYYWSTAVIFYFVPLLLLSFFNGFLILSVHRSLRERNRMTTGQQGPARNHQCLLKDSHTTRLAGHENDCPVRISIEGKSAGPTRREVVGEAPRANRQGSREATPRGLGTGRLEHQSEEPTSADCQQDLISKPDLDSGTSADKMLRFELDTSGESISDHATGESNDAAGRENFGQRGCNSDRKVLEFNCSANAVRGGTSTVRPECDNITNNINNTADNGGPTKVRCNGEGRAKLAAESPIRRMMVGTSATSRTRPITSEAPKTNQIVAATDDEDIISEGATPQNSNHDGGRASQTATTLTPISSQERRITIMLIAVVILFLCCQIPSAAMLLYTSVREPTPNTNEHALVLAFGNIFNFLMAINAAGNFILYSFLSKKYRRTFVILFCKCFQHGKHSPDNQTSAGKYLSAQYWIGGCRSQTSSGGLIDDSQSKGPTSGVLERWSTANFVRDKFGLTRQLALQPNELGDQLVQGSFAKHQQRDTLV